MPAVTVGIPFHDGPEALAMAVRSVFAQTFTDWELVLVDDGSTDGARDVAARVRDPRVRCVSDGTRRRLPARLNQIVDLSRSDLVARLDADDMIDPARLEKQLRVLWDGPTLDLVSTPVYVLDEHDGVRAVAVDRPLTRDPLLVLRRGLLAHATIVARRSWLLANRYDERYPRAEDCQLFARTCRTLKAVQMKEPLYLLGHRKDHTRTLGDYVSSMRDYRRILRDLGPSLVGRPAASTLFVESLAKEGVFRTLTALGQQDLLVSRRGRVATAAERAEGEAALRRIRETRVPGLDD